MKTSVRDARPAAPMVARTVPARSPTRVPASLSAGSATTSASAPLICSAPRRSSSGAAAMSAAGSAEVTGSGTGTTRRNAASSKRARRVAPSPAGATMASIGQANSLFQYSSNEADICRTTAPAASRSRSMKFTPAAARM